MLESVGEIVRKAETQYLQGNTKLGKYVNWSMHDTIERIDAYLNSTHISGSKDSLDREKPFFNIITAAVNIWYRATDIDRKDIRFIPTNSGSVVLAFIANVFLQRWMDEHRFGQFLNSWGRTMARYGSAIPKFVEQSGDLVPSIVPWNRFIPDSVQFDARPRIEKLYFTPAQLRQNALYDEEAVDKLLSSVSTRRTLDKAQKDNQSEFVEVYEVHGDLDSRLLDDEPDLDVKDKDITYRQQMHVISFVAGEKDGEWEDFTLYKGKEAKDPYMITHLIEEDGRTLSIGAVEYLFDAQWMVNHTAKNMKDTLDLASRIIFQTSDARYIDRNVLTSIETGDIMIYSRENGGGPLEQINTTKADVSALQAFGNMWQQMGKETTGTPDAMRGLSSGGGINAYRAQALQSQQAQSLFELMTENKGLAIEDMIRTYVIPHLKKQLKHKDELVAILDDAGVQEIDSMYVPKEAIKRYNKRAKEQILNLQQPQPFNEQQEQQSVKQELAPLGNKRFFKPDELGEKQWDELLSDFEWDSIRVVVTNEEVDTQAAMQTLTMVLQTIAQAASQGRQLSADERMVLGEILNLTGVLSPIQFSNAAVTPPPTPPQPTPSTPQPAGGGAGALPASK